MTERRWIAYLTNIGMRHYLNVAEVGKDNLIVPLDLLQRARLAAELAESVAKEIAAKQNEGG